MDPANSGPGAPTALPIGGWLILIAIGLVLGVVLNIRNCIELFRALAAVHQVPGGVALAVLGLEVLIQLFMLCSSVLLAALFFAKKHTFTRFFCAYVASLLVLGIASAGLIASVPNVSPEHIGQAIAFPIYILLLGVIWVPYFLRSKRVKATFVY